MEPPNAYWKSKKRALEEDDTVGEDYRFKILLPNGICVGLTMRSPKPRMLFEDFLRLVKDEYDLTLRKSKLMKPTRPIQWNSGKAYVEDANDNKIRHIMDFEKFKPYKCHILRLHDGSGETANTFENMWDLTPDTELLMELPEEYTFETALADLIDNSLQAVWNNRKDERRLISVDIAEDKISIFDTGPGMDGSDENSIVKWGKMGASLHRSNNVKAIGGKPPYLTPFFGMFGYGGPIASMHLGRSALVSSKTKVSKKVYTLHLKREALLRCSDSELTWRTMGGVRAPTEAEIEKSPHQSFTKVQISEAKLKRLDKFQLSCKLKDIYFPYIQCDEVSKTGKTTRPIEFQVNGIDLAEVEGGEVAITNLHSCNGPEFVLQLHFFSKQGSATTRSPGSGPQEANARLKCVYFPIKEGRESIEMIIEKLKSEGCGVTQNYESFSRVSIRRLGRLLPDALWALLPFMDLRQKKGDKASLLKRCCMRVKCFIDTDAGFKPTHSKTDLAQQNPFTTTLKNFGVKPFKEEKEINVEISRAGKPLTPLQLEKDYQDWLLQMHDLYDEEINCGEDQPVLVINPKKKKSLGITSDVVRVHQVLKRKGKTWKCGKKIKVLKGACAGVHKNNIYATLEYFLIEGFQGDAGGEARIICRPLGIPDENGCVLSLNDGITSLDIGSSLSLPISVIDSGKCVCMENVDWDRQVEKQLDKTPSTIDLLNATQCQELGIDGALPVSATAEQAAPEQIVAVVRPASFNSSSTSTNLDQKYIVKKNSEMIMTVKFSDSDKLKEVPNIYSSRVTPSSCKGYQGLYIFNLGCLFPKFFRKAGAYTFSFCLTESSCQICERRVLVKASSKIGKWRLLSNKQSPEFNVRVGSFFPPLSIACDDIYGNRILFSSLPKVMVKLKTGENTSISLHKFKTGLSANKLTLNIKDVVIESNELDTIRPHYKASLEICSLHELALVCIPCQVTPGYLKHVTARPPILENILLSGSVITELKLEMFDAYNNHVGEGYEVELKVDGFCCEDLFGLKRKVDDCGCVDLGGLLKVTAGYGKSVSFSVLSENEVIFVQEYQTESRELRISSWVPEFCTADSQLEDVVFEIVDSKGDIDATFHDDEKSGQSHTLTIKSASISPEDSIHYAFRHGCCTVPAIPLPQNEGLFCFVAAHSRYSELHLSVKIPVVQALAVKPEIQPPFSGKKVLPPKVSPSHKNVGNLMMSMVNNEKPPSSGTKVLPPEASPSLKNVGNLMSMVNNEKQLELEIVKPKIQPQSSGKKVLPLEASPSLKNVGNFMMSMVNNEKQLELEIVKPEIQPPSSGKKVMPPEASPSLKNVGNLMMSMVNNKKKPEIQPPSSGKRVLPPVATPSLKNVGNLMMSMVNNEKQLELEIVTPEIHPPSSGTKVLPPEASLSLKNVGNLMMSMVNDEKQLELEIGKLEIQPPSSGTKVLPPKASPFLKNAGNPMISMANDEKQLELEIVTPEIQPPSSGTKVLPPEASPSLKNVGNLMMSMVSNEEQLELEIVKYGLRIGKYEDALKSLNDQKTRIQQMLLDLEASIEPHILNHPCSLTTKEEIIKRIDIKVQSSAAILCGLNKEFPPQTNVTEEVVGVVALIGTVCTNKHSRILAEYLGEDQMLSVVCTSFEAACALEMYEKNGEVDFTRALHAQAAALGKSIVGRFHVICLEDISPYTGAIDGSDLQKRLALPYPILPSGNVPLGFLGYAVNMVNLDGHHLQTRTLAGYGLRETLFYRLFGKLQIYTTRELMIQARACIKYGAISLDGGILRENGIISLGHGNPEICFPVESDCEIMKKVKQIEEYKSDLDKIKCLIIESREAHVRSLKKFNKRKYKITKLLKYMELHNIKLM